MIADTSDKQKRIKIEIKNKDRNLLYNIALQLTIQTTKEKEQKGWARKTRKVAGLIKIQIKSR